MTKIIYILKKEFLVMGRDVHALAVLFAMPVAFILIMSLAMRDLFETDAVKQIKILVVDQDKGDQSKAFVEMLAKLGSIDAEVFAKTYRKTGDGTYVKTTPIWAEIATEDGSVATKEGESHYKSGDYLVYNNEDGTDAYCISAAKFESMYELDE